MNITENLHSSMTASMAMALAGGAMMPGARLVRALQNSRLVDRLNDTEISMLADLVTVVYLEAGDLVGELLQDPFREALLILVDGDIEISAMVGDESVSLHLEVSGDLARIVSFAGGDMLHVSTKMTIRRDSCVLLLQRSRLESLLESHPSIVYGVMRNLVLHVHGVARRKNAEGEQLKNYFFGIQGRY